MAKKAAKSAARSSQSKEESGAASEAQDAAAPETRVRSKSEAIRRALAAGFAGPKEGTEYIRDEFGMDVARSHFSATKSQLKGKDPGAPRGKPGRKPRAPVESHRAPSPKPAPLNGGADLLDSLETLKPLIAQYGADKVHRLVDLLD